MKKFSFPLDRVLAWRTTQTRLEEAALEKLRSELRALDQQRTNLDESLVDARDSLLGSRSATSIEIAALEHYRAASAQQVVRIAHNRAGIEQKIAQQMKVVAERRHARLLEKLRERRLAEWRAAADKEVEQLAEESYMSKFARAE
jgi:hypothetical protein